MLCHVMIFMIFIFEGGPSSQVKFEVSGIEEKEVDVHVKIARPQLGLKVLVVVPLTKLNGVMS